MFIWPKLDWSFCWVSNLTILLFCGFYGIKANVISGLGLQFRVTSGETGQVYDLFRLAWPWMTSKGHLDWYRLISSLLSRRERLPGPGIPGSLDPTHLRNESTQPVGRTFPNYLTGHIHTRNDLDIAMRPCLRNNTLKAAGLWSHLYLLKIQYLNPSLLQYSSSV